MMNQTFNGGVVKQAGRLAIRGGPPLPLLATLGLALSLATTSAAAATLVGITGESDPAPESLFRIDTATAATSLVMALGNGGAGEAIGFNPANGLLYHASGIALGDRAWESIDVDVPSIVSTGAFTGLDASNGILGLVYDPSVGVFLAATRGGATGRLFSMTLAGTGTLEGSTPEELRGLAFHDGDLYGASSGTDNLYTLNPDNGGSLGVIDVTLGGGPINGMNGLATDPDTGILYGVFRVGANRFLGTLNPGTGEAVSLGSLDHNFAGIAFLEAELVPEPSTLVAMAGVGLLVGAHFLVRARRATL